MDPASVAALQLMQQQIEHQATQMLHLQQQLQQQQPQQQQQQQQPQQAPQRLPPAPRLPPPPSFDGKASTLDAWVADMEQQFEWYGAQAEGDRMRFATGFIAGSARDWWTATPQAARPATWTAFLAALRKRFQPVTSAETARAKLAALQQGKASIHDYVTVFRQLLVAVPTMSEDDRLFAFTRGLRPAIATQLRVHGVKTTDAAIEMATRVGSLGELAGLTAAKGSAAASSSVNVEDMMLDNIEGLEASTNEGASSASAAVTQAQLQEILNALRTDRSPNRSYASSPKARDVTSAIGKRFKLTPEQVREHFDKNQCFNCDGIGHSSRSCSKPPKK